MVKPPKELEMMYIGYEYETAGGAKVRKLVACETREELRRIRARISEVGYTPIEFEQVVSSESVQ